MNLKNAFNFNNTMNNNNLMNYIYLNQMNYANTYGFNNQNINQLNLNNNINYYLGSQNAKVIEQKNSPIYPHKTGLQNVG